jgi:hypothetical protein
VFGDGIEDFFRAHFPRLKKRAETERFKASQQARAGPKGSSPRSLIDRANAMED